MSKRYVFPQQYGDRKKPRLDITISDHNFPSSQSAGSTEQKDDWGDENDDEILLMASQACEQAYTSNDISTLPDYSICMQPSTTSTQVFDFDRPSTSKTNFTFKKPTKSNSNMVSTLNLQEKCNRISSPLPGITPKVVNTNHQNLDNLSLNDRVYKGQDTDQMYRQLLQMQEKVNKLESENGKLLEKFITKEGETSILRSQLKTCQIAVDNARLDKLKAQEKIQQEWTDKLQATTKQMQELRTQLDFKDLEIISIKGKCKMLESSKLRLTQVTIPANDISSSHKHNNSWSGHGEAHPTRRMRQCSSSAQTDSGSQLLKLNTVCRTAKSKLKEILPLILKPTTDQNSLLEYNEKLQRSSDFAQNKCRIFSTFHRLPSSPLPKEKTKSKLSMVCVHEDLICLSLVLNKELDVEIEKKYVNILKLLKQVLEEVKNQLLIISQRMSSAFQREMDEKYIEATSTYIAMSEEDLLSGNPLYKEEQAILARRLCTTLHCIISSTSDKPFAGRLVELSLQRIGPSETSNDDLTSFLCNICSLCDNTSTAIPYSGLLLSITNLSERLINHTNTSILHTKLLELIKNVIASRPLPAVLTKLLCLLRKMATFGPLVSKLCSGNTSANLKTDYDQGVLMYSKDSCYLQVFLKELEGCFKCIEKQSLVTEAIKTTERLLAFYNNISAEISIQRKKCDCHTVLSQVIVYALYICAIMLKNSKNSIDAADKRRLATICRCGVATLYQWMLRDFELCPQPDCSEGHHHIFVETTEGLRDELDLNEIQGNMLSELLTSLQPSSEDMDAPSSPHRKLWLDSFSKVTISD